MAKKIAAPGRLISVDGSRGKDVNAAAAAIAAALGKAGVACAVSRWDASGLFGELSVGARHEDNISARTLALVYAADLAFRLRWEIRPVLEAGGVVIAAAYVDTAVAFGASCGLKEDWIRKLLRFAPAAGLRARSEERKRGRAWKRRADRGYPEYGAMILARSAPRTSSKRARQDMIRRLDAMNARRTFVVTKQGVDAIVKSAIGTRPGARRRSA
jgi:hypothetical protein